MEQKTLSDYVDSVSSVILQHTHTPTLRLYHLFLIFMKDQSSCLGLVRFGHSILAQQQRSESNVTIDYTVSAEPFRFAVVKAGSWGIAALRSTYMMILGQHCLKQLIVIIVLLRMKPNAVFLKLFINSC